MLAQNIKGEVEITHPVSLTLIPPGHGGRPVPPQGRQLVQVRQIQFGLCAGLDDVVVIVILAWARVFIVHRTRVGLDLTRLQRHSNGVLSFVVIGVVIGVGVL